MFKGVPDEGGRHCQLRQMKFLHGTLITLIAVSERYDPVVTPQKADMSGAKLVEIMHRIVPGCFVICHNAVHMGNLVPDNLNDRNA